MKFSYQNRRQPQTMAEAKQIKKPRKRNVSDDYPSMAVEKGERRGSPAINIPILSRSSSSEDISSSVGCYPIISMYNLDKSHISIHLHVNAQGYMKTTTCTITCSTINKQMYRELRFQHCLYNNTIILSLNISFIP